MISDYLVRVRCGLPQMEQIRTDAYLYNLIRFATI